MCDTFPQAVIINTRIVQHYTMFGTIKSTIHHNEVLTRQVYLPDVFFAILPIDIDFRLFLV